MKKILIIILPFILLISGCEKKEENNKTDVLKIAYNAIYDEYYSYECKDCDYVIDYQDHEQEYLEVYKEGTKIVFGISTKDQQYLQILVVNDETKLTKQINLSEKGEDVQIEPLEDSFIIIVGNDQYKLSFHKQ